ncbi:hypothetical protein QBD00_001605 [Ochrobactrum sp. AN78]|nr:hypothetical protein [Ochrobactrum sp. AN78]
MRELSHFEAISLSIFAFVFPFFIAGLWSSLT